MRTIIDDHPLRASVDPRVAFGPANGARPVWVAPPDTEPPQVVAYRLAFDLDVATTVRIHVSADERYELWLDGTRIGRGPERGAAHAWFYETYDLALTAGKHTLQARVWNLGSLAPLAQVSVAPGFMLTADPPYTHLLATGSAPWAWRRIGGYAFEESKSIVPGAWFVGANQRIDAATYDWDDPAAMGWAAAETRREDTVFPFGIMPAHTLRPATLPAQLAAPRQVGTVRFAAPGAWDNRHVVLVPEGASDPTLVEVWQALVDGKAAFRVPPNSRQHVVVDLENYYCAYPWIQVGGGRGAQVAIGWAESLYDDVQQHWKGQRDAVDNRFFVAQSQDTLIADGSVHRRFENVWWRAGRFVQFLVETADEALQIEAFGIEETRYPLEMESSFRSDDERLNNVVPLAVRVLQMCAHETYMDCPYYEQMMYVGDTRLEALTTYAITHDDRLPRKALTLFGTSRVDNGLVQARYPGRDVQLIPPFALWWVGMVHDYARWRDDRQFVLDLLPGVRAVLDAFLQALGDDGLVAALHGWNFADWVPGWEIGVPPDARDSTSGLINWHVVYTLGLAAELEAWASNALLAQHHDEHRARLAARLVEAFWNDERGLLADDREQTAFSEHTQCLALLSNSVSPEQRERIAHNLLADPNLTRTTIYFTHYLFEAYRTLGRGDALFDRLQLWFGLPEQGFRTTPEMPEPTRSDCHAWGAHPLYHMFATILGIRPATFGFRDVDIAPVPGPLTSLRGSLVHPRGMIEVELQLDNGRWRGRITLPPGVTGTFRYGDVAQKLDAGMNEVGG